MVVSMGKFEKLCLGQLMTGLKVNDLKIIDFHKSGFSTRNESKETFLKPYPENIFILEISETIQTDKNLTNEAWYFM